MSNGFPGDDFLKFALEAKDTIRELRWKAESALEYLRDHEAFLRLYPTEAVDQRRALWQPLADLLARASEDPLLTDDARLEAQRVWAEEVRFSALNTVSMCVYARSEAVRERFRDDPAALEELIERLELARPAALRVLSSDDLGRLRAEGFLRAGE